MCKTNMGVITPYVLTLPVLDLSPIPANIKDGKRTFTLRKYRGSTLEKRWRNGVNNPVHTEHTNVTNTTKNTSKDSFISFTFVYCNAKRQIAQLFASI